MADPYAQIRSALKARIVEEVTSGAPLRTVCAAPGMPDTATVRGWRRSDTAFAEALAQALRVGHWRRRWMFDEARAQAFLARYRAGERIDAILRDPAMPSRKVLDRWRATEAPFGEEIERLKAEREPERSRGLRRVKTPAPWDGAAADRVLIQLVRGVRLRDLYATDPTLPRPGVVARWRREQPEFDAEVKASIRIGFLRRSTAAIRCERLSEPIALRIVEGASLHSLSREAGMPHARTLYRWFAEHPAFAAEVDAACDERRYWYMDQVLDIAGAATAETVALARARMSPLLRQLGRLEHRPGWKRRGAEATDA